jgi:dipeptidyl aminopeptidase/acylaminoacyl peptidase
MSPITHVTHHSPPTLLIHGAGDNFVPVENTYFMDRQLTLMGVRHSVLVVPYADHEFDLVFGGLGEQLAEFAIMSFLRGGT